MYYKFGIMFQDKNLNLPTVLVDHLLTTNKESKTEDTKYIYRNELDKACSQHDMAYGDFKDLARRTAPDNILRDT